MAVPFLDDPTPLLRDRDWVDPTAADVTVPVATRILGPFDLAEAVSAAVNLGLHPQVTPFVRTTVGLTTGRRMSHGIAYRLDLYDTLDDDACGRAIAERRP